MGTNSASVTNLTALALRELKKYFPIKKETQIDTRVVEDPYVRWINRVFVKLPVKSVVVCIYDTQSVPDGSEVITRCYSNDFADMKKDKHRKTFGEGKDDRYAWFITETN